MWERRGPSLWPLRKYADTQRKMWGFRSKHEKVPCSFLPFLGQDAGLFWQQEGLRAERYVEVSLCISFLFAAVTSYPRLGGLKQHEFIIVQLCRQSSELCRQRQELKACKKPGLPSILEAVEDNVFIDIFQLLETACIP